MKKTIVYSLILGLIVIAGACSGPYVIENENPGQFNGKEAKVFAFAWIDLKEDTWKENEIKDKEEWIRLNDNMNRMFQAAVKKDFEGKEVIFLSKGDGDKVPSSADFFISYEFKKLERKFNYAFGGADTMYMDVKVQDAKTKNVVYTSSVKLSSKGSYAGQISLGGRLRNIAYALSRYLSEKIFG